MQCLQQASDAADAADGAYRTPVRPTAPVAGLGDGARNDTPQAMTLSPVVAKSNYTAAVHTFEIPQRQQTRQ
ncbi:hypothetical protein [Marinobacterium zhoushanense]|uniref:hypothetical protein n=1 Tax=Marinobacterium zhoushanense TaxID=1679163 RepID=UPI00166C870D|nr:hypothetical protein [Marinobacterium zhoushanense]